MAETKVALIQSLYLCIEAAGNKEDDRIFTKSENFAVSLRKTKRKQILNEKRGRFATL